MDAENFMKKALADLASAKWAFSQNSYDVCVRAAYYAVFHAEIAALIQLAGVQKPSWSHEFVPAEFSRLLIHAKKVFSQSLASVAPYLLGHRHNADYSPNMMSQKKAFQCLQKAETLVKQVDEKVRNIL